MKNGVFIKDLVYSLEINLFLLMSEDLVRSKSKPSNSIYAPTKLSSSKVMVKKFQRIVGYLCIRRKAHRFRKSQRFIIHGLPWS